MSKLIYSAITSLDGYVEDEPGHVDSAVPDEEVHQFVNALERSAGSPATWSTSATAPVPDEQST